MRSQKDQLFVGHDFDYEWREQKRRRPYLKHSVMLLVLSPRRDQVALVTPQQKVFDGRFEVMLPQYRCVKSVLGSTEDIAPSQAIHLLQRDILAVPADCQQIGFSSVHKGELTDGMTRHTRLAYVYGLQAKEYCGVLTATQTPHHQLRWCGVSELLALPNGKQISPRKFELMMQTIVAFHAMLRKSEGKLLAAAHATLRDLELLPT
jgi:hypothetical protein